MGKVRIRIGDVEWEVPLAGSTTFGRSPDSTWIMNHPTVPWTWLEVRWSDDGWAWRAREEDEPTAGPRTPCDALGGNWKLLDAFTRRVAVPEAYLQLVDASPPKPFLVDLATNTAVPPERGVQLLANAVLDASRFIASGRTYRYYAEAPPTATALGTSRPRPSDGTTRFRFLEGERSWRCEILVPNPPDVEANDPDGLVYDFIESTLVASIVPYVEARLRASDINAAALDKGEALERWRDLARDPTIPEARLYQYHGKFEVALGKCIDNPDEFLSNDVLSTKRILVKRSQLRLPSATTGKTGSRRGSR